MCENFSVVRIREKLFRLVQFIMQTNRLLLTVLTLPLDIHVIVHRNVQYSPISIILGITKNKKNIIKFHNHNIGIYFRRIKGSEKLN